MAETDYLTDVKTMLGLSDDSFEKQQGRLELIIRNTSARLLLKLKGAADSIPDELAFIVVEVTVSRFNRLKNEGMKSYEQEGEAITFKDSDFDDFLGDIDQWLDNQNKRKTLGSVAFIGRGKNDAV